MPTPISRLLTSSVGAFSGSSTSPTTNVPSETAKPRTAFVGPSPLGKRVVRPFPELFCDVLTASVSVPCRRRVPVPSFRNVDVPVLSILPTVTSEALSNTAGRPVAALNWNPGISTSGPV